MSSLALERSFEVENFSLSLSPEKREERDGFFVQEAWAVSWLILYSKAAGQGWYDGSHLHRANSNAQFRFKCIIEFQSESSTTLIVIGRRNVFLLRCTNIPK